MLQWNNQKVLAWILPPPPRADLGFWVEEENQRTWQIDKWTPQSELTFPVADCPDTEKPISCSPSLAPNI